MKNILLICLTIIFVLNNFSSFAQSDKAEKREKERLKKEQEKEKKLLKKWKEKQKDMEPLKFKGIAESAEKLDGEIESLKGQLSSIQDALEAKEKQNTNLKTELTNLLANPDAGNSSSGGGNKVAENAQENYKKGIIFKVQIRYVKDAIVTDEGNSQNFSVEEVDGKYKYTLGYFRDYWEADNFKKYLQKMGLKDAWLVAFKDNERVNVADVLSPEDIQRKKEEAEKGGGK